ncbi:MAG: 4-hydroxythreonine-4-phosphate dehydrogenase PdxA [Lepagella sp.]
MNNPIRVAITQGDFNGVGLEVALKALADENITELFTPILFADHRIVEHALRVFQLDMPHLRMIKNLQQVEDNYLNVVHLNLADAGVTAGTPTKASGRGALASIDAAIEAIARGDADVMVTAPICKEAIDLPGFTGHTEYLGAKAGGNVKPQMILFDDHVRVALVTTHLPVSRIAESISVENIEAALRRFNATLCSDYGVDRPKIAILSLNPHCGDGGLLGDEEKDAIIPAIEKCFADGLLAFGPYAADGFFGTGAYRDFDGVLAMYHDQGLAPFKSLARENGVNFTAGLPYVRTSPDHGTAYDIAWQGVADPTSMREAIYKALDIYRCRHRYAEASANPLKITPPERNARPKREGGEPRFPKFPKADKPGKNNSQPIE